MHRTAAAALITRAATAAVAATAAARATAAVAAAAVAAVAVAAVAVALIAAALRAAALIAAAVAVFGSLVAAGSAVAVGIVIPVAVALVATSIGTRTVGLERDLGLKLRRAIGWRPPSRHRGDKDHASQHGNQTGNADQLAARNSDSPSLTRPDA